MRLCLWVNTFTNVSKIKNKFPLGETGRPEGAGVGCLPLSIHWDRALGLSFPWRGAFSQGTSDISQWWLLSSICIIPGSLPGDPANIPGLNTTTSLPACQAGDASLIPESGRSFWEWNGYPLQYSCLENPMDRGAWWATVHEVAESDVTEWPSAHTHTHTHTHTVAQAHTHPYSASSNLPKLPFNCSYQHVAPVASAQGKCDSLDPPVFPDFRVEFALQPRFSDEFQ